MTPRKVHCEVIEGLVYEDRCLYKLCQVTKDSKTCESCILRELERFKSVKTNVSDVSFISSDIKISSDVSDGRTGKRRSKRGRKRTPKFIGSETPKQMYSSQELSKVLGKAERTLQEWAQKGKIPAVRVGIKWRFPKEEVDRWLSQRKGGTVEPSQLEEKAEQPEFQKPDFVPVSQGEPEKDT